MSAPFRLQKPGTHTKITAASTSDDFSSYLTRLMKLIPVEIISLYMVGSGLVPEDQPVALVAWSIICGIGLMIVRVWGTSDLKMNVPPDWVHVGISEMAYLVWLYSMGGPFAAYGLHVPYLGSLLVLAWTFFLPFVYKGPAETPSTPSPSPSAPVG